MAVTEEPTQVDERPSLASPRPPARARILNPTWVLVLLGVLAAVALAVVALRPGADPAVANHGLIIENGSITAVDHAAEVERGGASRGRRDRQPRAHHRERQHHGCRSRGRGRAWRPPGGGATGNHGLIIENGSITAVDHAAEVTRQWLRPHRR